MAGLIKYSAEKRRERKDMDYMTEDQKHLLKIQLYNQFQNDRVIGWVELLKIMAETHGADRDTVFAGMNELIDEGKIAVLRKDTYCFPEVVKKLEAQAWQPKPTSTMARDNFDRLSDQDKMDFCNARGVIA